MKLIALTLLLFTMTNLTKPQEVVIELKDGKKIETIATSYDDKQLITKKGKYEYSKIKLAIFRVKEYDNLKLYEKLDQKAVEFRFAIVPH